MLSTFRESASSAFADWRFCVLTVCGTSPSAAGLKNADAAPNSAPVTKKSGSVMWCVRSITAVNAWTTARTPSQASITARRGSRSATTPPASVNDDAGERERGEHAAERSSGAVDREDGEGEGDRDERVARRGRDAAEPEQPERALGERRRGHPVAHGREAYPVSCTYFSAV